MLRIDIPGYGLLRIQHLVLDYNGTLALDGRMLPGIKARLRQLADRVRVHVVTADTFGRARSELRDVSCKLMILGEERQSRAKAAYLRHLDARAAACIGNGRNDRLMLRAAALSIAVIQAEGAAGASLLEADVVVRDVRDGLDLLLKPLRLVASLRS